MGVREICGMGVLVLASSGRQGDAEAIVGWERDDDRVLLVWVRSALNTA